MAATDRQILDLVRKSLGYVTTVGPVDKRKVDQALAGQSSVKPRSALGEAAWHLALRAAPPPVLEPPPKPVAKLAPQAYNPGSRGQNAKFNIRENCTQSGNEYVDGGGFRYDDSGLCKGGRTEPVIPGLKPSDEMDGREPWEVYLGPDGKLHPPYPPASYEK